MPVKKNYANYASAFYREIPVSGVGGLVLIFAEYVPLASQSPYPIIAYSVTNYRAHLTHLWVNM